MGAVLTFVCDMTEMPARGKKTLHVDDRTILLIAGDTGICAVTTNDPAMARKLAHGQVLNGTLTIPGSGTKYELTTGQCVDKGAWSLPHQSLRVIESQVIDGKLYLKL